MAEIAAIIAFAANYNNDKVGLMLFSDQIEKYIPPGKGDNIFWNNREILEFQPVGRKTDLQTGLAYLSRVLKKKSILMLFSDFLDTGYERPLKLAGSKHDLILMRFTDPREKKLPEKGLYQLQDSETDETILLDLNASHNRRMFSRSWRERETVLQNMTKKYRIDEIEFLVGQDYERPLLKIFRRTKKTVGKMKRIVWFGLLLSLLQAATVARETQVSLSSTHNIAHVGDRIGLTLLVRTDPETDGMTAIFDPAMQKFELVSQSPVARTGRLLKASFWSRNLNCFF